MSRWLAVFLLTATGLAAQQPPSAPLDSGAVARVLALLKTSDSTVCELAGQAISNSWGFPWEPRLFPTPMPMPMPTPMPMPMARRMGIRVPHVHVHVHHPGDWRREDATVLGAFRAVLRDDSRCVRHIAARVLGRARSPGSYDAFLALLREASPGLRETGALGLGELEDRSEEHTSELQSLAYLVCRLLLEKKKKQENTDMHRCIRQERMTCGQYL